MNGSWMSREVHVQFWERVGVKLPCATHRAPRAADEEMCLVRCATAQPMREEKAPRDRLAGAGPKSPSAAVVKSHGREHGRKRSGNGSDQIGNREMNESEPLMTCRNVYQMRSKPGGRGCPGISRDIVKSCVLETGASLLK